MAEKYRKLPGRGVQLYGVKRLYAGADHILQITFAGGAEEYRRFYFADIQAVIIRRTSGYIWWSIVWGVLAISPLLPLLIEAALYTEVMAHLFMVAVFSVPLIFHLALGPTCSVVLQTAVHKEPLTSLTRLRGARKMLAYLTPLIAQAQADLEVVSQASPPSADQISSPQIIEESEA